MMSEFASTQIIEVTYLIATALFIFVVEVDELAGHGPPRCVGWRIGHAAGCRWNSTASRHRGLQMVSRRAGAGHPS
jgi:hypothetical protein